MLLENEILFLEKILPFYKNMKEKELINNNSTFKIIKKDTLLSNSERECTGFVVVVSGLLRVFLSSENGKEITLYRLLEGDSCVFTSSCIFNDINFNVSVEAICDTKVIIIPSKIVETLSKTNLLFQEYLLKLTQSKMSDVMWLIQEILFNSFDKRLKNYLLEFNEKKINITHSIIANDLGTAREVVSRMLKYFEKEGFIKVSRGSIEIINLK